MSNLKLSTLLYYAQGFCLAMRGEPLFSEAIEAWRTGPVVPEVDRAFKHGDLNAFPDPSILDAGAYLPEDRELLDAIMATYGRLSAGELDELARSEAPWRIARGSSDRDEPVGLDWIKEFFADLLLFPDGRESGDIRPHWPLESFRHQKRRALSRRLEGGRAAIRAIAAKRSALCDTWDEEEVSAERSGE